MTFKKLLYLTIIFALVACSGEQGFSNADSSPSSSSPSGSGTGGSLARFIIVDHFLYIATDNSLYSFDISTPDQPELRSTIQLENFTETIFSLDDKLLLGTMNGVLIYSIDVPSRPEYLSTFWHVTSCDPVVARGDFAFSTLRQESSCNRGDNRMDIINIANINNPYLARSISMENPKGLGIQDNFLYVCDNSKIKTFDITNPASTQFPIDTKTMPGCYDVIPYNGNLIIATKNGIHQYKVETDGSLTFLSTIPT